MAGEVVVPVTEKKAEEAKAEGPVDMSVALGANNPAAVAGLGKDIAGLAERLDIADGRARLQLLEKARDLVRSLETPRETMIKHCWAQPTALSALAIGVNLGLYAELAKDDGSAKKVNDLAKKLGADPSLLGRLMRHLAAMGYIIEVAADEYKPTNFSKAMSIPVIGDGYPCVLGGCLAGPNHLPAWLAAHEYKTPNSVSDGPYQEAYRTELNFFQYLQANPPFGVQFNHHMGGYRQGRPSWMDSDFFPVQERLVAGAETGADAAFLVDIGGSVGHDLDEFHRKHPDTPGRLILQDLPIVIGQIVELDASIERMSYDFHTPQPVKGARAYYMHSCLHDWPDEVCQSILKNITDAMKKGYSKLLINENVIPATNADWQATALDIMMLGLLSARERTEADWRHLLEGLAGLKIVKIWSTDKLNGVESLIECELP